MKGFEPKVTQILTTRGRRTDYVFKVMGSKVMVTETFAGGGVQIDGSCTVEEHIILSSSLFRDIPG